MLSSPSSSTPLRSFEVIARKISAMVQAEYRIGQRLPAERVLAQTFGVSRPTIREAILSLVLAGMVEVRQNSGAYVVRMRDVPDVQALEGCGPFENLEVRLIVEPQVAAIAADKADAAVVAALEASLVEMQRDFAEGRTGEVPDHRFHVILAETTGNNALVSICDSLWQGQIESQIWQQILQHMPMAEYRPVWLADHVAILDAIKVRSAPRAKLAMKRHLGHVHRALMASSNARAMQAPERPAGVSVSAGTLAARRRL